MNELLMNALIPVFAMTVAGFGLRKLEWLTEEADHSLLRLTLNLLYPCLIIDAVAGSPALRQWGTITLAPLVGFGTFVLGVLVARLAYRPAGLVDLRARRTFAFTTGLYNYGYIPIPLALALFGNETASVLFVHNVGVDLGLWTVGLMFLTGRGPGRDWKKMVNAPLVAIVLALVLNWTGAYPMIPQAGLNTLRLLAQCAIPMSLILIGAMVADHWGEFHSRAGWRVIAVAVLLRLGVLPLCFLLLAWWLPASVELKRVIVLEAAMPSAVFPIVMSKHYGGDPPTALRVVVGTSLLGLLTIPLWIRFGLYVIGR